MPGLGRLWGSPKLEWKEWLHPRDKSGKFRTKGGGGKEPAFVDRLSSFLEGFNPRSFQSDGQVSQHLHNISPPVQEVDQRRMVGDWADANAVLNSGEAIDPSTQKFVDMMDRRMIEAPDDMLVNMSVGPEAFGLTPETMGLPDGGISDFPGALVASDGYTMSTMGSLVATTPITMSIAVPKGTRIAPTRRSATDRGIALDRGQGMRITKVTPDGRGGYLVMAVADKPDTDEGPAVKLHTGAVQGRTPQEREARFNPQQAPSVAQAPRSPETGRPVVQGEERRFGETQAPDVNAQPGNTDTGPGGPPPRQEPVVTEAIGGPAQPQAATPEAAPTPAAPAALPDAPGESIREQDFRTAVREAGVPSPSEGPRRRQWNSAYLGIAGGKKQPVDVLRELDKDIDVNQRRLEQQREGIDAPDAELEADIDAQRQLASAIRKQFNLPEREGEAAPEAPETSGPTPTPGAPSTARGSEPTKAAPAKATAPRKRAPAKKAAPKAAAAEADEVRAEAQALRENATAAREERLKRIREGRARGSEESVEEDFQDAMRRADAMEAKAAPAKAAPDTRGGMTKEQANLEDAWEKLPEGERAEVQAEFKSSNARERYIRWRENGSTHSGALARTRKGGLPTDRGRRDVEGFKVRQAEAAKRQLDEMEQANREDLEPVLQRAGVAHDDLTDMQRLQVGLMQAQVDSKRRSKRSAAEVLRGDGSNENMNKIADAIGARTPRKAAPRKAATPKPEPGPKTEDQMTKAELLALPEAEGARPSWTKDRIRQHIADRRDAGFVPVRRIDEGKEAPAPAKKAAPKTTSPTGQRLTPNQQKVRDMVQERTDDLLRETGDPQGGWVSEADIGSRATLQTLVAKGVLESIEEPGPRGGIRRRYRPVGTGDRVREAGFSDTEADFVRTGTDRRQRLKEARTLGEAGARLDQLLSEDASDEVVADRLVKGMGISPEAAQDFARNRGQLRQMLDRVLRDRGITRTADAGSGGKFDRKSMSPIGDDKIPDGADVRIVRPGLEHTDPDGTKTLLRKAQVEPISEREAKAIDLGEDKRATATPFFTPDRAADFTEFWNDKAKVDIPDSAGGRSINEVAGDISEGRISLDEGIRRLEVELELNNADLLDMQRERRNPDITPEGRAELFRRMQQIRKDIEAQGHAAQRLKAYRHRTADTTVDEVLAEPVSFEDELFRGATEADRQELMRVMRERGMEVDESLDIKDLFRSGVRQGATDLTPEKPSALKEIGKGIEAGKRMEFVEAGTPGVKTVGEMLREATPEDRKALAQAMKAQGLDFDENMTAEEMFDDAVKQIVQREIDSRAAKKAGKAAPKPSAPKRVDAPKEDRLPDKAESPYERLDVRTIGQGLEFTDEDRPMLDTIQKLLDGDEDTLGKNPTPAKVGRWLETAANGPASPGNEAAVARGVRNRDENRVTGLPQTEADNAEFDRRMEILDRRQRSWKQLADRLMQTRRQRKKDRAPETEPDVTPEEKADLDKAAELTGIPTEQLEKQAVARKRATAPAKRSSEEVAGVLKTVGSREEADGILKPYTKAELADIAKAADVDVGSRDTKAQMSQKIVQFTVGRRLDSDALVRAGRGREASTGDRRQELMDAPLADLVDLENELGIKRGSVAREDRVQAILDAEAARRPPEPEPPGGGSALTGQAALDAAVHAADVPAMLRAAGLPEAQVLAADLQLRRYGRSDFNNLNEYLYGLPQGDIGRMKALEMLEGIDPAFQHSRLTDDVVVYRGSKEGLARSVGDDSGDLTGREWTSPAFVSTSANRDVAEGFARDLREGGRPTVMRIRAPKGTSAVALSRHYESADPDNVSEAEIVLGRDLRYRVMRDYGVGPDGVRRLDVEVTPAPSPVAKAAPRKAVGKVAKAAPSASPDPEGRGPEGLSTDPAVREVQVENRIRAAYDRATKTAIGVPMVDLRRDLVDLPRAEVDEALRRLSRHRDNSLVPEENQKVLTQQMRDEGVDVSGRRYDFLLIGDGNAQRPVPSGSTKVSTEE